MPTNFELRMKMRKIIRPNLQVLLLIALIAALPGLIASVATVLTGSDLMSHLLAQNIDTSATTEQLFAAIQSYASGRLWGSFALTVLQALVTPVLTLGLITAMLTLLRGGTVEVTTAFSRLSVFGRSVLLMLLLFLKLILWALPGTAVMTLSMFLGENGAMLCFTVGSLLMFALLITAAYRYAMAYFFLADQPENSALACIRKSKAVMKNRKLQLFSLELPYLAGNYIASTLISLLFTGVIGTTLSMVVELIFTVYLYGARSAFFEAYSHAGGSPSPAPESDPYHSEMKDDLN